MLRFLVLTLLLARPALAFPALWAVHGPHATVYLLGSVHVVRPGTIWESPAIDRAVSDSQEMWFETNMSSVDTIGGVATTLLNAYDLTHNITDRLTPPTVARLQTALGPDLNSVEHLRPWLLLAMLANRQWSQAGYSGAIGVDVELRRQAQAAGKPIHGIETASSQIRLLAGMSDDEALGAIQKLLATPKEVSDAQMAQLERAWLDGNVDSVDQQMRELLTDTSAELARRLLTDRNKVFADVVARLAAGDKIAMVTVGVGHMAGEDGVPALLQKRGLSVERVR